jgi:hypothetical protein
MQHAYTTEGDTAIDFNTTDPHQFLPAPSNWNQVIKLPPRTKKFWIASFVKELKEVLRKGTVEHGTPNEDDAIIPVTVKLRVKLSAEGLVEKLKTQIALRGDLMRENLVALNKWCPITGFRVLKIFLAFAVECKH